MPEILPLTPSDPNYAFTVTLAGFDVQIAARWNARDRVVREDGTVITSGSWKLDWFDSNGDPIVIGMKIVLGVNLGRQLTHPLFRRIVLRAVDTSKSGRDAGLDDLGTRVVVRVYTISERGLVT